jgi:hypothetical protein
MTDDELEEFYDEFIRFKREATAEIEQLRQEIETLKGTKGTSE